MWTWTHNKDVFAFRIVLLLVASAVSLAAIGCSDGRPQRVPVSGQVLIDGQPLEHGFIQVVPEGDRPATGQLGPDGRFRLMTFDPDDGCVPGRHPVAVIANESLDATSQRWNAPKKYASIETSELEVDIQQKTDSLEIHLSWEGGQPFVERFEDEGE